MPRVVSLRQRGCAKAERAVLLRALEVAKIELRPRELKYGSAIHGLARITVEVLDGET